MRISAVLLARVIAFVESYDLNARGMAYYPEMVEKLVRRYGFKKFPQKVEELDETKGVEFVLGKDAEHVVERMTIFNTGLLVETRLSTEQSKDILERALAWARQEFGLTYEPGMIKRWAYLSNVSFYSESPILNAMSQSLGTLASRTGKAVSEIAGQKLEYKVSGIAITHDPLLRKYPLAGLTIQYRSEVPYEDNKFFSEAPLPTDLHIRLLEQFESDVMQQSRHLMQVEVSGR